MCRVTPSSPVQTAEIACLAVLHCLYTVSVVLFGMKGESGSWSTIARSVLLKTTLFEFGHVILAVISGPSSLDSEFHAHENHEHDPPVFARALPSWGCYSLCSCEGGKSQRTLVPAAMAAVLAIRVVALLYAGGNPGHGSRCCSERWCSWSPGESRDYRRVLDYINGKVRFRGSVVSGQQRRDWQETMAKWRLPGKQDHVEIDDRFLATWAVQCAVS